MPLAIFDIDGTITITKKESNQNYWRAFLESTGVDLREVDWKAISSSTDPGIVDQILLQKKGVLPTSAQLDDLVSRLVDFLSASLGKDPDFTRPVAGSVQAFRALPGLGWSVALASGSWKETARLKLDRVGLDIDGVPGAFGDDATRRADIIELARARASQHYDRDFKRVVYIGDGAWDARAASRAGVCFVGIGQGEAEDALRGAGACQVIDCYRDLPGFMGCLAQASCPAPPAK